MKTAKRASFHGLRHWSRNGSISRVKLRTFMRTTSFTEAGMKNGGTRRQPAPLRKAEQFARRVCYTLFSQQDNLSSSIVDIVICVLDAMAGECKVIHSGFELIFLLSRYFVCTVKLLCHIWSAGQHSCFLFGGCLYGQPGYYSALNFLCEPLSEYVNSERKEILTELESHSISTKLSSIQDAFHHFCNVFLCCYR